MERAEIRGARDVASVDGQGLSLAGDLDGVRLARPRVHVDHRGALLEIFTAPEFWESADFAYAYQTSVRPGMLKGWFQHHDKLDRYHIVKGELLVLLYDDRSGSPTRGQHQKVVIGESSGIRGVLIPQRIWHLSYNVGQEDAILLNLPSTHYDHENPDRYHVDIDSGQIPVDVRSFFPVANAGPQQIAATFC